MTAVDCVHGMKSLKDNLFKRQKSFINGIQIYEKYIISEVKEKEKINK